MPHHHPCHVIYATSPMDADVSLNDWILLKKCHIIIHAMSSCIHHAIDAMSCMSADMFLDDGIFSKKSLHQMPCHHPCYVSKNNHPSYQVIIHMPCHLCHIIFIRYFSHRLLLARIFGEKSGQNLKKKTTLKQFKNYMD